MEPVQSYHIYNHANGSENIFREEENYRFFLQKYDKYLGGVVHTYAYCLIPNYFQLLVGVKGEAELVKTFPTRRGVLENLISKQFSNFFSSYTQSFNKKYQRKGSLFIKNFKRNPILTQSQWQHTFLYIYLNPIKHGFTKDLKDWKWSSWNGYQTMQKGSLLNREYYFDFFDGLDHLNEMVELKKEGIINKDFE